MPGRQTGRGRKRAQTDKTEAPAKRLKIGHDSHRVEGGIVLAVGEGEVGQLGLGEDIIERSKPGKVNIPEPVIQVFAGGMHTVCLTAKGEVYTFGCNDESALGRDTSEEGSETLPEKVKFPEKVRVVQISAGDSHSAGLTDEGSVFVWGTFRDANGVIGLMAPSAIQSKPIKILEDQTVVKIASGSDHVVCLTKDGDIYTMGNAEQGQLGRIAECMCLRGGRKGLEVLIKPCVVRCKKVKGKTPKFEDIWAGSYVTYAKERSGEIYAWGLNNYFQLGTNDMRNRFVPEIVDTFKGKKWKEIATGQHHTIALNSEGKVFALGRKEYGRLGLGEGCTETKEPKQLATMNGTRVTTIASGSCCSFAVTTEGKGLSWGMGSSKQLALADDEDAWEPSKMMGKQLENRSVLMISSGGQHTVLLVKDNDGKS